MAKHRVPKAGTPHVAMRRIGAMIFATRISSIGTSVSAAQMWVSEAKRFNSNK